MTRALAVRGLLRISLGALLLSVAAPAAADSRTSCQKVVFDCTSHMVSILGNWTPSGGEARIDCGMNTDRPGAFTNATYPGVGQVSQYIPTVGNPIPGGFDISGIDGMGVCGGSMVNGVNHASIIHTLPDGRNPSGTNASHGCVHVSQPVMSYIGMHCIQAKLEIKTSNMAATPPRNCSSGARTSDNPFSLFFQ